MENLIPIGQFAAASQLSAKALRLYDENGLLRPALVHPDSGYRFYRLEQLRSARLIGLLRSAGMPLVEIRRVLDDPCTARIDEYEEALAGELTERRRVLDYVRRFIEEEQMFEVQVKQVQEVPYVSRSKRVRVAVLKPEVAYAVAIAGQCEYPEIIGAYDAVAGWAKLRGRELDGPPREIYLFDPDAGEEPRMEIAWAIR